MSNRQRLEDMFDGNASIMESLMTEKEAEARIRDEFTQRLLEQEEVLRERIAGELHDRIGQDLTAIRNYTYLIKNTMTVSIDGLKEKKDAQSKILRDVAHIDNVVADMQRVLRSMLAHLWPEAIDNVGFEGAIQELVGTFREMNPDTLVSCYIDVPPAFLPDPIYLYRIISESLTNVSRHAQAKHIWIDLSLSKNESSIILSFKDDGIGFDTSVIDKARFGIRGVLERVKSLGGECFYATGIGSGTTVTIELPVKKG